MLLRRLRPYMTVALLVAMIYAGWTVYSRWRENRTIEQEAAAKRLEFDQKTLDMIGPDLKIMSFYANPTIQRGQKALVCYSVANATSVRIEPAIESITPSLGRCVETAPKVTTEYTLTAEDGSGHRVSQTTVVKVQ
jgi:hypothetical protein